MPFDWWEPTRSPGGAKALAARRDAMYVTELEERCGLLQRLRFSKEKARTRLLQNVAWDFEPNGNPHLSKEVEAIVERVYARGARRAP